MLNSHGPLTTKELHPLVKKIHPDLCDDTIDRIIDGKNYGKKWWHAVRTSQQKLQKKGLIQLSNGKWEIVNP